MEGVVTGMDERYQALLRLQEMDREIGEAEEQFERFAPELGELDAPVLDQQKEVEGIRSRLDELKADGRRLERAAEEKRDRLNQYEARMDRVRNAREEAAVRTEIDLVRRAVEADEDEGLEVMDRATRTELKLDELEEKLDKARAELEPARLELMESRDQAEAEIGTLRQKRDQQADNVDSTLLQLYEQVRGGRTRTVLASLTDDGACSSCFSMIPIQQRNELRDSDMVHRCEACGVILYADD